MAGGRRQGHPRPCAPLATPAPAYLSPADATGAAEPTPTVPWVGPRHGPCACVRACVVGARVRMLSYVVVEQAYSVYCIILYCIVLYCIVCVLLHSFTAARYSDLLIATFPRPRKHVVSGRACACLCMAHVCLCCCPLWASVPAVPSAPPPAVVAAGMRSSSSVPPPGEQGAPFDYRSCLRYVSVCMHVCHSRRGCRRLSRPMLQRHIFLTLSVSLRLKPLYPHMPRYHGRSPSSVEAPQAVCCFSDTRSQFHCLSTPPHMPRYHNRSLSFPLRQRRQ